jgi:hypothetical protein
LGEWSSPISVKTTTPPPHPLTAVKFASKHANWNMGEDGMSRVFKLLGPRIVLCSKFHPGATTALCSMVQNVIIIIIITIIY